MFFQVLSHASLLVRSGGRTLVTDPWLIGSCYWRSWWNYPPVKPELIADLRPDVIYITHVHWDHFHGATLKRCSKETPIVVPLERSTRVKRDLTTMGFRNVIEIPHGKSYEIGRDFRITSYQFSHWGDSAVVIEAEGVRMLNANDAKFMGWPLDQIIKNHQPFDFAFRSHSSANNRVCYYFTDKGAPKQEDPVLYAKSFYNFMEKVKPKYAVPFASNHCHLHRDVYPLNRSIETPARVEEYVASAGEFSQTELKVMVSGDSWDSLKGFQISPHDWFTRRDMYLEEYREANQEKLRATYEMEDRARVRLQEVEKFFRKFLAAVPWPLKRSFQNRPVVICAKHGEGADYFQVDVARGRISQIPEAQVSPDDLVFETSALILKRAMALNMFSHIGISKRVAYRSREQDAKHLQKFTELLAAYEYEALPLRRLCSLRTVRVYARRWREVLLYVRLVAGVLAGKSLHQLEAEQLGAPAAGAWKPARHPTA